MLLLFWPHPYAYPNQPDKETLYFPLETGSNGSTYRMLKSGNRYIMVAGERTTDMEYRALPSRR